MSAPESERRKPIRMSEVALALAERPAPVSGVPSFKVSQTKAVGGATVYEWDVHVPVCDEFPDSQAAFDAVMLYSKAMRAEYGPTNGGAA